MKKIPVLAIAVGSLALQQTSFAALEDFAVSLNGAQDGGGARTGSGSGTLTLDTVANTLTFNNISWGGLSADTTAVWPTRPKTASPIRLPVRFLTYKMVFGTSTCTRPLSPAARFAARFSRCRNRQHLLFSAWGWEH